MSKLLSLLPKNTLENKLLLLVFIGFFVFFIVQPPLFSPDTYSYLRADITRFPGYIIYLRLLQAVFGANFGIAAVAGHLVMGFAAVVYIFKNINSVWSLSNFVQVLLLGILLFPYFKPIEIAVNLTSEGLAYPLYLLFISFTIDFIFKDQHQKIGLIALAFLGLVLTRGQFVIVAPIIAVVFILKLKKHVLTLKRIGLFVFLLALPVLSGFADRAYRYVFYGHAETTPYSYVNAVALPLYVSSKEDALLLDDKDHQLIYRNSFQRLDSLQLLSSAVPGSYTDKYMRFHYNFPKICNQNIHDFGLRYYLDKGVPPPEHAFAIEAACKAMFPKLIAAHFSEWLALYYTSIVHGFKSVFVLFFVIVLALLSFWKALKKFTLRNGFVLLGTLLVLSNAMIVAVASHSIMRYLFYNYFIGMLILILLLKKFIPRHES